MKKTRLFAAALCAVMLSACAERSESTSVPNDESASVSSAESNTTKSADNDRAVKKIPTDSKILRLCENNISEEFTLDDEQWSEYCGIMADIVSREPLEIANPYQSGGLRISPESGELLDYCYMTRHCDGYNEYILDDDTAYPVSEKLNAFIKRLMVSTPDKRLIGTTFKCAEPVTDEEYLHAAEGVIGAWLETLKSETGRWHVDEPVIVEAPYGAPQVAAISEDGKTFAAVVWFDYPDVAGFPSDSIFARHSNNAFVHKGEHQPGVYGLFGYENGLCEIIDYVDVNEFPNGYKFGLGGACDDYETFFEFLADSGYTEELLREYPYRSNAVDSVLSHNVMRLANGEIYFLAIGPMDDIFCVESGDKIGGPMKQEFYTRTDKDGYNSPVYYDRERKQPRWIEFDKSFKLVFDDYNGDGNPDFAIKVGSDENGSTYCIECMEYMGMPTPRKGEIYVYGRFEDSIRLQMVESGKAAVPVKTDNGIEMRIFDISGNNSECAGRTVDNYRLYSQRYYMPNAFNSYSAGTEKSFSMHGITRVKLRRSAAVILSNAKTAMTGRRSHAALVKRFPFPPIIAASFRSMFPTFRCREVGIPCCYDDRRRKGLRRLLYGRRRSSCRAVNYRR